MGRLIFICDHQTALGFRLAGLETVAVDDDAEPAILTCLTDSEVSLVAVSEQLFERLSPRLQERSSASNLPLVVCIPQIQPTGPAAGQEYTFAMIRRAIGYQLRIRR